MAAAMGKGFTVIVKFTGAPEQPLAVGVTVITPEILAFVVFVPVNAGIDAPLFDAPRPIAVLLLAQAKVTPVDGELTNVTAVEGLPAQIVWLAGGVAVGVGFTVIVNVLELPLHPPEVGVIVIVATTFVEPVFTALKDPILPLPLAASPIDGVLFVQLKMVFGTFSVEAKSMEPVATPLQTVIGETVLTVGFGFTVIVKVTGLPAQPFAVGVTVMRPEIAAFVVFVVANAGMVDVLPAAAKPIAVLLFVHAYVVFGALLPKVTSAEFEPAQTV